MIRISVVLPCFNHSQYLSERINSVLAQTRPVDEIIFLDDSSTDNSLRLAQALLENAHCPVLIGTNSTNSGSPFKQWNKGINLASGDLVWLAETDDTCSPEFLERVYGALVVNNASLAFCQSEYIDMNGHSLGSALSYTDRDWPGDFAQDFSMDGRSFNSRYMSTINAIPNASAVLLRRSAYLSAGMANPSMRFCGDWEAWIRLIDKDSVTFVAEPLNRFRCHSTTTRSKGHMPEVQAEYFACRLSAYMFSLPGSEFFLLDAKLKLPTLLKLLSTRERSSILRIVNSISWQPFYSVQRHFGTLGRASLLSPPAKALIVLIAAWGRAARFARRLCRFIALRMKFF